MRVRYGRRGPFVACSAYPDCKNTERVPKEWFRPAKAAGETPPPEDAPPNGLE